MLNLSDIEGVPERYTAAGIVYHKIDCLDMPHVGFCQKWPLTEGAEQVEDSQTAQGQRALCFWPFGPSDRFFVIKDRNFYGPSLHTPIESVWV